jgi:hypothetical protein
MNAIFEALAGRMAARKRTHTETLVAAARRLATGESVDDAAVAEALEASGQTLDDFQALAELCQRRRTWYVEMDRGPAAVARRDKATATLEREKAAFEQIQNAWFARAGVLEGEIAAAGKVADAARAARGNLVHWDHVPGELAGQIHEAHEAVAAAHGVVATLERERRQQTEREKSERDWAEHKRTLNLATPAGDAADHERAAKRAARRLAEIEKELPAARQAVEAAEAELRRLEAAALKI